MLPIVYLKENAQKHYKIYFVPHVYWPRLVKQCEINGGFSGRNSNPHSQSFIL
jgi:hypothetical protein